MSTLISRRPIAALVFGAGVLTFLIWNAIPSYAAHGGAHIVVTSTADAAADDGVCTLREAITAANSNTPSSDAVGGCAAGISTNATNPDRIQFNISGTGPHTIQPATPLPIVMAPVDIDGTTQPGFSSSPVVVLDGTSAGSTAGLNVSGGASTIRGMAVVNFAGYGVFLQNGDGNVVAGNYIGLAANGTTDAGNANSGVGISNGSNGNTVGGTAASDRNVISGNGDAGVEVGGVSANTVQGNYIGTNGAATARVPNAWGVLVLTGTTTQIGGPGAGEGNVISGNNQAGVQFQQTSAGTVVEGNRIGVGPTGNALFNSNGVVATSTGAGNVVGGTGAGDGNIIASNLGDGVNVGSSASVVIQGNSVHSNGDLGIDLHASGGDPGGVTANDPQDPDTGANGLQNYPDLQSAAPTSTGAVEIEFTFNSLPNSKFQLEFFVTETCDAADPSDFGEGQASLETTNTLTTDGSGNASGTFTSDGTPQVEDGDVITATATRLDSATEAPLQTSEFSECEIAVVESFTVNSENDPGTGSCDATECTLREAITAANSTSGLNVIQFDIAGTAPHRIEVQSNLGGLTDPAIIDGTTEPDFVSTPVIEIDASLSSGSGLQIFAGGAGSTIRGLAIFNATSSGIVATGGSNVIQGNYLGTDTTGLIDAGNGSAGLSLTSAAPNNTVGGIDPADRNVIVGNGGAGVQVGSSGNVVQGNYLGIGADGSTSIGNGIQGITLNGTSNAVGGTAAGARNVISGNSGAGVFVTGSSAGTNVSGNYIGVTADGLTARPNADGITVFGTATGVTIGGSTTPGSCDGGCNLIAGNTDDGVTLEAGSTEVVGNWIGLGADGSPLGNTGDGVQVTSAANTIGGSTAPDRNVISGNGSDGVELFTSSADNTVVHGNYIGLGSDGSADVGNNANGVALTSSGIAGTSIGGAAAGQGNVISANGGDGIQSASSGITNTTVQGNLIGLASDGSTDRGNEGDGIRIMFPGGTTTVGGTTAGARNVLSGNGGRGLFLQQFGAAYVVQGNLIGMNAAGTSAVANGGGGALIQGSSSQIGGTAGVTPGGSCTGACNLVSGNTGMGLHVSSGALVKGNYIGTDVTGLLDRGNSQSGITGGTDSSVITIGGSTPADRNVVSGNDSAGLAWTDIGANNDVIRGNYVGVGSDGTTDVGNGGVGIQLNGDNNAIGGTGAGAGNVIAFNGGPATPGISLTADALGNSIRGNSIHSHGGLGIDIAPTGVNANDAQDADGGGNAGQNFPFPATAEASSGVVTVQGTFSSSPSSTFHLDFYTSPSCNDPAPSNHGEGRTYLGELTSVTTDTNGQTPFTFTSSGTPPVAAGEVITATATSSTGNTSEFSRCRVVQGSASPTLSIADAAFAEGTNGTTTATLDVTLSAPSTDTVTVDWATGNGTAASPGDYEEVTNGSVSFAPTVTTETIDVTLIADALDEQDETFVVTLSNPGGATIADGQATGTITDDDAEPQISISDVTVPEGNSGTTPAAFQVSLSAPSGKTVTVDYETVSDSAVAGSDFQQANDTLTFDPGEELQQVAIEVLGDIVDEPNETFVVDLSGASNATAADAQGTGTITDDDAPPPSATCLGKPATIVGTPAADVIPGTPAADVIAGLGANDVIFGVGGNDIICGGDGNDKINGGKGNDRLVGDAGNDKLKGAAGNDKLRGGAGRDVASGGPGRDKAPKAEQTKSIP